MKALRNFALLTALLFMGFGTSSAQKSLEQKPSKELTTKVKDLVRNTDVTGIPENEREATIKFILTNENELLVTDVETDHDIIENQVKSRLNYKRCKLDGVEKLKTYKLDVSFVVR